MKHMAITDEYKMELAEKMLTHTVQLTRIIEEGDEEKATGTSLLISYGERLFLVSSGHTFSDDQRINVGVNLGGDWHRLMMFCEPIYHLPDEAYDDDFAVLLLNEELSEKIRKYYTPLHLYSKDFKVIDFTPQLFVFIGYPATKTRYHPVKKINERAPYAGWMSSMSNKIEYFKGTAGADLFKFSFHRERTTKGPKRLKQIFPIMNGISGSGLFSIRTDYSIEFDLLGIVNRYSGKDGKVLGYHIANVKPVLDSLLKV
jgi:hypothetical protein